MGLFFETREKHAAPDHEFLNVVSVFMKLTQHGATIKEGARFVLDPASGYAQPIFFDGETEEAHPTPDTPYLYRKLEFSGPLSGFVYFAASSLRLSVTQTSAFILSSAHIDTYSLLTKYDDRYGQRDKLRTLKLELVNPGGEAADHNEQAGERTAPSYLMGEVCERRWFRARQ